jgi:hypothetical protein
LSKDSQSLKAVFKLRVANHSLEASLSRLIVIIKEEDLAEVKLCSVVTVVEFY